jgi:hypothetical protein
MYDHELHYLNDPRDWLCPPPYCLPPWYNWTNCLRPRLVCTYQDSLCFVHDSLGRVSSAPHRTAFIMKNAFQTSETLSMHMQISPDYFLLYGDSVS